MITIKRLKDMILNKRIDLVKDKRKIELIGYIEWALLTKNKTKKITKIKFMLIKFIQLPILKEQTPIPKELWMKKQIENQYKKEEIQLTDGECLALDPQS